MNREDIIRMAEEAAFDNFEYADDTVFSSDGLGSLTKFAQLVAAHEREACAQIADDMILYAGQDIASTIRARNK